MNKNKYFVSYVYKIFDDSTGINYIGSCCSNRLFWRLVEHIYRFHELQNKEYNKNFYKTLRENNKNISDLQYEILEVVFNTNKTELHKKEKEYIRNEKKINLLNTNIIF